MASPQPPTGTKDPEQASVQDSTAPETETTLSSVSKGKRKATEEPTEGDSDESGSSSDEESESEGEEPQWHTEAQDHAEPVQPRGVKTEETKRPKAGDWEAIWSAQHNAYYFHNTKTKETTWTNPMTEGAAASKPAAPVRPVNAQDYGGVDPELAYLDSSLRTNASGAPANGVAARFNARTGKFEGDPNRNPEYHSDFARAKRQSSFFFDVDAWEKQRELEQASKASGAQDDARKKQPSKKEMEMYRAKKQERKKAKLMARYGD